MPTPALLGLGFAVALGGAWSADYRLDSRDWNGLAGLGDLGARLGCPVVPVDHLAWDRLTGRDVLWLLQPRRGPTPARLSAFLAAGGRAVVADDRGAAGELFAALSLQLARGPIDGAQHHRGNRHLPLATSRGASALALATPTLITNHPARFVAGPAGLPPTYAFADGSAVVVEGRHGRGRFVALADPSLLINNMLELDEDRRFAAALIAVTCEAGRDRILLLGPELHESGEVPAVLVGAEALPLPKGADAAARLDDLAARGNQWLAEAAQGPGDARGFALSALLAAALLLLVVGRRLPSLRLDLAGSWTRAHAPALTGLDPAWQRSLALAGLRDEVGRRLAALDADPSRLRSDEVAARISVRRGSAAALATTALLHELAVAPSSGLPLAGTTVELAPPSRRRLGRLHRDANALFALLANDEESSR